MKLYTIENVEKEEVLGVVSGSMVKGKFFIKDFLANIRKVIGKELKEYTELMEETRNTAISRMIDEAEELGADAIIGIRFMTSDISKEASEIFVYGTAIREKK